MGKWMTVVMDCMCGIAKFNELKQSRKKKNLLPNMFRVDSYNLNFLRYFINRFL